MALHYVTNVWELFGKMRNKSNAYQMTSNSCPYMNAIMAQPNEESQNSLDVEPADINDVLQGKIEVNHGKIVKKRKEIKPEFTDEENAMILSWLEDKYKDLYGRGSSYSVSDNKREAWEAFTKAVNDVHDGKNKREVDDVFKRINNMKTNSML